MVEDERNLPGHRNLPIVLINFENFRVTYNSRYKLLKILMKKSNGHMNLNNELRNYFFTTKISGYMVTAVHNNY